MILSKKYLEELIKQGKAQYTNTTAEQSIINDNNKQYVAIDRLDLQRVDHYEI